MSDALTIKELTTSPLTDMLTWAVMTLISHFPTKNFLEHFGIDASNHNNTIKVELKINGVEVSPREVFDQLDKHHTEMVKNQAMKLIKEKFAGLDDITTLISELRSFAERKASSALGVEWRDNW